MYIHTQQLPAAIVALKEAALALAPEDQGTSYMIGRTFMRQWQDVASWKKVWGVTSRAELVQAMGEMALSPNMPPSLAAEIFLFLVREFFARHHELHLAAAVSRPLQEGRFPNSGGIALSILKQLLALAQDTESVGPDEAGRYFLAAARVVSAPDAPVADGEGRALATHLLDLLEQRVQLGFDEDGEALALLAHAPAIRKNQREKARYLAEVHVPKRTLEDA